jgi:hypothetical protein
LTKVVESKKETVSSQKMILTESEDEQMLNEPSSGKELKEKREEKKQRKTEKVKKQSKPEVKKKPKLKKMEKKMNEKATVKKAPKNIKSKKESKKTKESDKKKENVKKEKVKSKSKAKKGGKKKSNFKSQDKSDLKNEELEHLISNNLKFSMNGKKLSSFRNGGIHSNLTNHFRPHFNIKFKVQESHREAIYRQSFDYQEISKVEDSDSDDDIEEDILSNTKSKELSIEDK